MKGRGVGWVSFNQELLPSLLQKDCEINQKDLLTLALH